VSHLATSLEPSNGFKTWTMEVDHDAHWSDNTPITSDDMKFTFDCRTDQALMDSLGWTPQQAVLNFRWKGQWGLTCDIIDEHTVELNTDIAIFDMDFQLAGAHPACLPKTAIEADPDGFGTNPTTFSGPFVFDESEIAQYYKVVRNDNWWLGSAYLDGIKINVVPEESTILNQLEAGELDVTRALSPTNYDRVNNNADLNITTWNTYGILTYTFNTSEWPASNLDFRKAVFYACDWPSFTAGLLPSAIAEPNYGYLGTTWAVDPNIEDTWPYKYDMTQAQQHMDAAAAVDDIGTVDIVAHDGYTTETEYIATQLQNLGVDTNVQLLDRVGMQNIEQTTEDWHIGFFEVMSPSPDPNALCLNMMGPSRFVDNDWRDDDVQGWLNDAAASMDQQERTGYYRQCEQRCIEAAVYMPFYRTSLFAAYRTNIHDPLFVGSEGILIAATPYNNVWKG